MSSARYLRDFISERLTAAAEEIFCAVENTIVRYEEEVDRQRRLLDVVWNPVIKLHRIRVDAELPRRREFQVPEEVPAGQERKRGPEREDPGPPPIKTEQEGWSRPLAQGGEPPGLKREAETPAETPDRDHESVRGPAERDGGRRHPPRDSSGSDSPDLGAAQSQEALWRRRPRGKGSPGGEAADGPLPRAHAESPECGGPRGAASETESGAKGRGKGHQGKKVHVCDICGKGFPRGVNLRLHTRTHTGERPFSCQICGKAFPRADNLKLHTRTHTGERPYSCQICGKAFKHGRGVTEHVRTHTGERPYSCKVCGKAFARLCYLRLHARTHTGERPYACQACGKTFARVSSLKMHVRTHTDERPYSCKACGKTFKRASALRIHTGSHRGGGPHACLVCGRTFKSPNVLNNHMSHHANVNPYTC